MSWQGIRPMKLRAAEAGRLSWVEGGFGAWGLGFKG